MGPRLALLLWPGLLGGASGCSLSAPPFAGSVLALTLSTTTRTAPDEHIEIWARTEFDDVIRIDHLFTAPGGQDALRSRYGFVIRNAIDMGDPCMIDVETGALLTTAEAYPSAVTILGVPQSPEEQAAAVRARIAQVTSASNCDDATPPHCGRQGSNLLAAIPFGPTTIAPPDLPRTTPPSERRRACLDYWASSALAYTPNPSQLIAPLHGTVTGFFDYITQLPVAGYGAIRVDSSVALRGIRELFMTVERHTPGSGSDGVDPLRRGPLFVRGVPSTRSGRDVTHFELTGPTVSGSATIYDTLADNTNGF
jgi:hypothetical protein